MSVTKEQLKIDLAQLNHNKDATIQNYNQILGAISVLEQLIKKFEEDEKELNKKQSEQEDGEIIDQESEQAA